MSRFPLARRDFLRTGSFTLLGAAGLSQTVEAQSTSPGDEIWSFATDSDVTSSPTVVDGTVFVGSDDENVYALDADDGSEEWSFQTLNFVRSSPTVVNGKLFIGSDDNVYALDADDGSKEWIFDTGAGINQSPTVADGTVYVGNSPRDNTVYALDADNGSEEWSFQTGRFIRSSPTVVDGTVFVGSADDNMYALDADDGSEEWSFQENVVATSSPTVVDGTVFIGSDDSNVYALDADDGSEEWSFQTGGVVRSSPTVADGTVFIGSDDSNVYALDADDGSEEWRFQTSDWVRSSPTVVDGTVFVGSNDNNVYALDAGISGSSEGSRVNLGTLGHDNTWADKQAGFKPESLPAQNGLAINDGVAYIVSASRDGEIQQVDLDKRTVIDAFDAPGGSRARGLAYADGSLWFADGIDPDFDGEILELNPDTGEIRSRIETSYDPRGLAYGDGSLWVVDITTNDIVEYALDGTELGEFDIQGPTGTTTPRGLAYFDGSLWVGTIDGFLYKFSTGGALEETTGERDTTYGGLATTSTELLGPDEDGNLTVLRTLDEGDGPKPNLEVSFTFDPDSPNTGEPVTFNAGDSTPADEIQEYRWDFTGDGETDDTGVTVERIFEDPEEQTIRLTIVDGDGNEASTEKSIQPESPDDPEPKIDATSIDIDPYPVEQGDNPEIRIIVEDADEVDAILEKSDQSVDPDPISMEQEAEDQWVAKDRSVSFDELGWWDLRIEAKSGTGDPVTLDTFEIDDPRDPDDQEGDWLIEDQGLGFHVFEEGADVAVVVGWFADEDPPTDSEVAELSAWFDARERDTNYYFGSKRGMRGLVGFNLELRLFDGGEVFEVESREYYEEEQFISLPFVSNDAADEFMQDLKSTAFPSDGLESYDFWIGTHLDKEVGDREGKHVTDEEGLYAPIRSITPKRKQQNNTDYRQYVQSYNVWNHEIGHTFDFGHPNDIGNQGGWGGSHMCVMVQNTSRLPPKNRSPTSEITPVPPVSTLHYLTEELEYSLDPRTDIAEIAPSYKEGLLHTNNQLNYERKDWLQPLKTRLNDIGQKYTSPKFVKGLNSYDIGDVIPIVTANTNISGQTIKYVFESRALIESNDGGDVDWSDDTGALVIYKWEQPEGIDEGLQPSYKVLQNGAGQRAIKNTGEEIKDELDDGRVVVFQLDDKKWKDGVGNPSGFHTEVKIKKEPGDSNTQTVTLDDPTSIPAGLNPSCFAEYTSPSLDLKAIDSDGRIVGITDDGECVNQIPGAKASGKSVQGTEWINVPENTDVDFRVSSADVDRFIKDMEQLDALANESDESDDSVSKSELEDRLTREYGVSQTTYGDNPELVEDDGETVVTDTTTRVQREEIPPGDEQEATPRNPFSDVDLVAIYPDTESLVEERVVLTNHGDETLNLAGWQLMNDSGATFVLPEFELDPGQEVAVRTGTGEDTDTDLYRNAEQPQWNPDGGQVQIVDNTGTTVLSVTYDDRGVIEYDDTREENDEPDLADFAEDDGFSIEEIAAGGAVTAGLAYLASRMLRGNSN